MKFSNPAFLDTITGSLTCGTASVTGWLVLFSAMKTSACASSHTRWNQ
jgi:hypothetical protein